MAEKNVKSRIQVKRGTYAEWKTAHDNGFQPLEGEIIFYSDLNKIKIGNGEDCVDDLPYVTIDITDVNNLVLPEIEDLTAL